MPKVEQEFDANVDPYIRGIDEMMAKNQEFLDELDAMIERVGELEVALDSLPRDIVITIRYEEIGRPDIVNSAVTQTVNVNRIISGNEGNLPPVTQNIREQFSDVGDQMGLAAAQAHALRDLIAQMQEGTITSREFIAAEKELTASQFMAANMAARQANAQRQDTDAITAWWEATNRATPDGAAFATTMAMAAASIARANAVLAPFSAGMRSTAVGLAAIPIAGGLAAFGITSLGTAIHLVIMGVAEFLAVFLPAMYAAAAGAYVMMQGVQLVAQHLNGLYTATEALGPMFNVTAGDMLGLGHSIQTAQDLANPGVFELLGLAIGGINAYSGRATLGLNGLTLTARGAAGGLTDFSQVGLDVTHMLDAFGARVVADLQGPLGGTLHALVASATNDLQTFGQILGNLGHAILSLAAAMPGLAEVILHVVDGVTALIKWFSQLPAGLLTAIFVIEEMYRWSGLLAGAFGLLGRGIALLGTLGLPVFAAIGRNVATMVANVVAGIANMVVNFVSAGARVGIFGARVEGAAASIVSRLGGAVAFLEGPWGIAFGLGVVAVGALVFWMSRLKDATQQWINSAQQAVDKASNLQVLNVIAQQMAQSQSRLASANAQLNQANTEMTKGAGEAATKIKNEQDQLIRAGQAAGQAAGQTQVYTQKQLDGSNAAAAAATKINELTAYQKTLVMEQTHVVEGATQIAKAYGVDFVTALGLADMAGVKLSSSIGKNGQLTAQAAIQIGALVLGYEKMDQTGGILANSMSAVNVQAGIQSSKVQQLNQAWDQFIQMGTGLTGTFTQFQLDLGQMGNQAQLVGNKIHAFTGTTQQSVSQIATALKSFGQSSAQTWQAYNSSITQANTFTDSLRVAAAAGVVSQRQYGQAVASVVQQLLPYASQSKAALAELSMIAQEAGGPAYNNTKSLTGNYKDLKNWTDQNAVSSNKFAGMLNDLTAKITNVSAVARNFAGTLQTDVLNAMAQAGASTTKITALTQAYTNSLTKNGAQSPQTKAAQDALTKALEAYGFKATDITQMENILSNAFGKNTNTINQGNAARKNLQEDIQRLLDKTPSATNDINNLASAIQNHGAKSSNARQARLNLIADLEKSGVDAQTATRMVNNLSTAINNVPKNPKITVVEVGSAKYTIQGLGTGTTQALGTHTAGGRGQKGMRVPGGYGGGDIFPAWLEPGEAVVPKHLVAAIAPFLSRHRVPGFASGGFVDTYSETIPGGDVMGMANFTLAENQKFQVTMTRALETSMNASLVAAQQAAAAAAASFSGAGPAPAGAAGSNVAALRAAGARYGWGSGAEWNALNYVEMREAGYSLTARNPSSGAYGMAQFINGPSEYYQYGGNPNTAWGQAVAMTNYIRQRYGDAIAAANHERNFNWYDQGGWIPPGISVSVNGTGRPERVLSGNEELVAVTPIQVNVNLDGKRIFTAMQQETFKYNMRNRGQITGGLSPLNK